MTRKYSPCRNITNKYFGDKFHILPENFKRLFQYCIEVADKPAKPTEDEDRRRIRYWAPTEEEI